MQKLYNLLTREDGQTMAEYGIVLSVIAIGSWARLPCSRAASSMRLAASPATSGSRVQLRVARQHRLAPVTPVTTEKAL